MTERPIRVLILDDDRGVAEATVEALAGRGIDAFAIVATVEQVMARVAVERPDVVVADIDVQDGLALELPGRLPDGPPVLWWSGHRGRYRRAAARAVSHGFVDKQAGLSALVDGTRRVAAGEILWTDREIREAGEPRWKPPTPAERDVLVAMARGMTNEEIAAHLGKSVRTVERQLEDMRTRYSARNRVELAHRARSMGWI